MKKWLLLILLLLSSCGGNIGDSSSSSLAIIESSSSLTTMTPSSIQSNELESTSHVDVMESFYLTPDMVPESNNGNYPSEGEYTFNTVLFYISSVMRNEEKYSIETIQMKKEVSFFYNITPLSGELTISLMKNSFKSNDTITNTEEAPKVYVSDTLTFNDLTLTHEVLTENDSEITYKYHNSESFKCFKIANESNYAQYLKEINWKK